MRQTVQGPARSPDGRPLIMPQDVCAECAAALIPGTALEGPDNEHYCPDCFSDRFAECDMCCKTYSLDDLSRGPDGDTYCEDCFSDRFGMCHNCEETFENDELAEINHRYYCESCRDDRFSQCEDCGEWISNDYILCGPGNGEAYCEDCWRDRFTYCEGCDEAFDRESMFICESDGCSYCESCFADHDDNAGIHSYSYKPKPCFRTLGTVRAVRGPFFGVELEIENSGGIESNSDAAEKVTDSDGFLYCKSDSSLESGFEIVSHPFSWEWHKKNGAAAWREVFKLRNRGFTSYDSRTCGMHVHISKRALTDLQIYKMIHLLDGWGAFTHLVSRRNASRLERWAGSHGGPDTRARLAKKMNHNRTERYRALNLTNRETVEVRIFRGTLSPKGFERNIEFCKALVDFTAPGVTRIADVHAQGFVDFVARNRKAYSVLAGFLRERADRIGLRYAAAAC